MVLLSKKEERKKLENLIEKGKWNYVFEYGVVRWGVSVALFMILFTKFILDEKITSSDVFVYFIIFGICGILFGLWTWSNINEKIKAK